MSHGWSHLPEHAAWSALTGDRVLDGAVPKSFLSALSRTQHLVFGFADTDRRLSEGPAPRLPKEAASSWNHDREISQKKENRRSLRVTKVLA